MLHSSGYSYGVNFSSTIPVLTKKEISSLNSNLVFKTDSFDFFFSDSLQSLYAVSKLPTTNTFQSAIIPALAPEKSALLFENFFSFKKLNNTKDSLTMQNTANFYSNNFLLYIEKSDELTKLCQEHNSFNVFSFKCKNLTEKLSDLYDQNSILASDTLQTTIKNRPIRMAFLIGPNNEFLELVET